MRTKATRIATIGVYGFSARTFLDQLRAADVALLIDVRQRRGVRGAQYAWANARRLQALLAGAGIAYSHNRELAPTTELRQLQYRHDAEHGIGKRNRQRLSPAYARGYLQQILDAAELSELVAELPPRDAGIGCLMCVETDAPACHRSLIAARLAHEFGLQVVDLAPGNAAVD